MNYYRTYLLIALTFTTIFNIGLEAKVYTSKKIDPKTPASIVVNPDSARATKKIPPTKAINNKRMVFSNYVVKDFAKWEQVYNKKAVAESKFAYTLKTDTTFLK